MSKKKKSKIRTKNRKYQVKQVWSLNILEMKNAIPKSEGTCDLEK